MSTFSRLSNLAKGLMLTRGDTTDPVAEAALDDELRVAKPTRAVKAGGATRPVAEPEPATQPIELDEHGNAKRTL